MKRLEPRRGGREAVLRAAEALRAAKRPLIISGGGVRYSGAETALAQFAHDRGIPLAETIAGKGAVVQDHPAQVGAMGIEGTDAAKALAEAAGVVVAIGLRLRDFTPGSWATFAPVARFININATRFDAHKHRAHPIVGDALVAIEELDAALGNWRFDPAQMVRARSLDAAWNRMPDEGQAPASATVPSYPQVIATVHRSAKPEDTVTTAAGGLRGRDHQELAGEGTTQFRRQVRVFFIASATRSPPDGATRSRRRAKARRSFLSETAPTR